MVVALLFVCQPMDFQNPMKLSFCGNHFCTLALVCTVLYIQMYLTEYVGNNSEYLHGLGLRDG